MEKKFVFNVDETSEIVAKALANVYYEKHKEDASFSIPADSLKVAVEAANLGGMMMLEKIKAAQPTPAIDKHGCFNGFKPLLIMTEKEIKPLQMTTCKWYEFR